MRQLDRLNALSLYDVWPTFDGLVSDVRVPVYRSGSPLARSWGVFDARPLTWAHGSDGWCFPGNFACWNITNAFTTTVVAAKRICDLEHGDGLSPAVFGTQSLLGIDAFARLKELKLSIAYGYCGASEYENRRGLRHLLRCVRDLETLELEFGIYGFYECTEEEWFTYESVFPRDVKWPHLRRFVVHHLQIRDVDLVQLLFVRMVSLQHLEIGDMRLLRGTWERVIESLRFRGLSTFKMESYQLIYEVDKCFLEPIMEHNDYACKDFIERIERYVVHWQHDFTLRHPSLKTDQPTQDSLDFLELGDDFGQLQQIRGTECTVVFDPAWLKTEVAKICAEANRKREGKRLFRQISTATADCLACNQRRTVKHPSPWLRRLSWTNRWGDLRENGGSPSLWRSRDPWGLRHRSCISISHFG